MTTTRWRRVWCFSSWTRKLITSVELIRFSSNLNTKRPFLLTADIAATPPRFPDTTRVGVWPLGAHVFPSTAVKEIFASSSKYRLFRKICG